MTPHKVTVDGMSACGKTRLIAALAEHATTHYNGKTKPQEKICGDLSPITSIEIQDAEPRSIDFWEVSYSSYGRLTVLAYPKTKLVLFCFPLDYLDDPNFEWDVKDKVDYLISKESHKGKDAPLILVGCRNDLRKQKEDAGSWTAFREGSKEFEKYARKNHLEYFECSAENRENIAELFQAVIGSNDSAPKKRRVISSKCILL